MIVVLVAIGACAPREPYTPPITDADGNVIPGSIALIEAVVLGGVAQTITIRGVDRTKPVLLHLHSGPGMPSSPWATWNDYYDILDEHFVLVHWDQRGAGKSYSPDLTADDSGYNHARDLPASEIPVCIFAGRHDYVTPGELANAYYEVLEAPAEAFVWFENSAHDVFFDEPDKFSQEIIRIAQEVLNL